MTWAMTEKGYSQRRACRLVGIIRDLSLVVLLFTPTMPVMSVLAYRYASEG